MQIPDPKYKVDETVILFGNERMRYQIERILYCPDKGWLYQLYGYRRSRDNVRTLVEEKEIE